MGRGIEKPPWWAVIVIVAGLIFLIVGLPLANDRGGEPLSKGQLDRLHAAAAAADASDKANAPRRILIVGDSYTGGSDMGGNGPANWTALAVEKLKADGYAFTFDVAACGGAGYTQAGTCGQSLRQLAEAKNGAAYDLALFFGSRNDHTDDPGAVQQEATATFAGLRAENPKLQFLVIAPPWVNDNPPSWITRDRDQLADAAQTVSATFVDPIKDGWFAGEDSALIGSDGIHPTDQGHAHMADLITPRIEDAIKALGGRPGSAG